MIAIPAVQPILSETGSNRTAAGPETKVENALANIPGERRTIVRKFLMYLVAASPKGRGVSPSTKMNYIKAVNTLDAPGKSYAGKPYKELTKDDFVGWVNDAVNRYRESTVCTYKVLIKRFIRWVYDGSDEGEYPPAVKWIKVGRPPLPDRDVLKPDEIKRLVGAARCQKGRAIISVLSEGGFRTHELAGLRVRDVEFGRSGTMILCIRERQETKEWKKTGGRRVVLYSSAPELRRWLEMHPDPKDPDAPLWPSDTTNKGSAMTRRGISQLVCRCARDSGLDKHVSPHLFRHSAATHLILSGLPDPLLKKHMGWSRDSKMVARYTHTTDRDYEDGYLRLCGVVPDRPGSAENSLAWRQCPNCKENNSAHAKFCDRCGSVLDLETAMKLKQADELPAQVLQEILGQVPELVNRILEEKGLKAKILQVAESGRGAVGDNRILSAG